MPYQRRIQEGCQRCRLSTPTREDARMDKIRLHALHRSPSIAMTYAEFRTCIQRHLEKQSSGVTWQELRDTLKLPYARPCPEWTRRLEEEIGLVRRKGQGRSLHWTIRPHF